MDSSSLRDRLRSLRKTDLRLRIPGSFLVRPRTEAAKAGLTALRVFVTIPRELPYSNLVRRPEPKMDWA